MGTYDTILIEMKCPYCKEISIIDFQTKDGDYCMRIYKVGNIFQNGQFRRIAAVGSCQSMTCDFEASKEDVWKYGYYGGFSRNFEAYIYCDSKGRITNKVKVYRMNHHKGCMKGILGELKNKEDNCKYVGGRMTKKGWYAGKKVYYKTNGWIDKFKEDSFDNEKESYKQILYLYNLEDSEEAMSLWFGFRYRLPRIIDYLRKELKIKDDLVFASVFLSNKPEDLIDKQKGTNGGNI